MRFPARFSFAASALFLSFATINVSHAQNFNWDGDNASGDFLNSNNWYGNSIPSFSYSGSLIFNLRNNASQTSQYYNFAGWANANDIIWETTWGAATTFNGNGQGINFKTRIENRSSYTVTIGTMNLSGGKDGATEIQLNPVNGDLTLNGNIYNDSNLRYKVYGANQKLLTINTALTGNSSVALDIEQNSKVSIIKAQTMGSSAAYNVKQGELWLSVASALANGSTINLGQADANTAKLYLNGANDSHAITVANTTGTKVLGTISASGTQTFSGNITLNGNVLLEATQSGATVDFTTGAISGSSGVTITGTGTVKLSGNNSYTGGTTVSAGTLLLGADNRLSDSGSVTVSGGIFNLGGFSDTVAAVTISGGTISNGTLTGSSYAGQSGTVSAVLAGSGALTKTTSGTLTLSGANTYTGGTTVNAGTLQLGNNDRLSNSGNVTVSGGTLDLGGFSDTVATVTISSGTISNGTLTGSSYDGQSGTVSAVLAGSGVALNKTTSGILTLSGANTYSGGLTLSAGTINLNNAAAAGTGTFTIGGGTIDNTTAGSITLNNNQNWNGDFTFTGTQALNLGTGGVTLGSTRQVTVTAGNLTVGGIISGNFGLTKAGAGTLILSGASTYTGATTVSAGVLNIQNATATGTTANGISVTSGAALQIQGGIQVGAESLTLNGSGVSNTGALRNISSNNTYGGAVTLGSASTIASDSGTLTLSGTVSQGADRRLTILGSGTGVTISGNITGTGSSDILKQGSSTLTLSGDNSGLNPTGNSMFIDQGTVYLNSNTAGGASSKTIDLGSGLAGSSGFTASLYAIGGRTIANAITIQGENSATLNIGSDSTADDNTFTGSIAIEKTANFNAGSGRTVTFSTGILSGAGGLTKTGLGTVILGGVNSYSGTTTISAGTLALTNNSSLSSSDQIKIGQNGLLDISQTTTGATLKLISENALNDGGSIKLGSKTLIINGGAVNTTNQMKNIGVIGDTGAFTLSAANSSAGLRLYGKGANSSAYTGATTVTAGNLVVAGSLASTTINLSGGNLIMESTADIADSAVITISSSSSTLTVGASDTIGSLAGAAGTVAITGTLTLGATADTEFSGVLQGSGALVKQGTGTFTISGTAANTYTGTTTINNGTLVLNKTGVNALAGTPTINNGGTLKLGASDQIAGETTFLTINTGGTFDMNNFNETLSLQGAGTIKLGSGNLVINPTSATGDVFSGDIQGTGGITKQNTGVQVLSGASSYSGATAVNAGTLQIRNASALGTTAGATTVANNAALVFSNATSMSVAENLTLNGLGVGGIGGALANAGGSNTQSGSVTLGSSSRIAATAGSLAIQGGITGGNYVLFIGAAGGDISIGSIISGVGATQSGTTTSLFKDGTGILTLTGANTYSGDTRITQGTLTVGSGGNLGNGDSDVFISSGATLNVNADTTVDSVQETATSNGGVISIGTGATLTIDGASKGTFFQNSISGAGNLRMAGSGTTSLGLYGTQNYTGTTTVSNGTLSTGVALSTSGLILDGGVFETTGANIISSSSSVTINGGEFKFGNDSTDTDVVGVLAGTGGKLTLNAQMTTTSNTDSSYAGNISGSQGIVKQGTGILTLTGVSDGTGSFFIDQGGVNLNLASGSIGNRSIDIGGGVAGNSLNTSAVTLRVTSGSYNNTITINSEAGPASAASGNRTIDFANTSGTATLSGTVALEKSTTVSVASGGAGELTGAVTGAGGISKSGSGRLTLNNANNTYSGGTTLSAGQLRLGHQAAAGTGTITQSDGTSTLEIDTTGTVVNAMNIYNVSTLKTVTLSGNKTLNNATYDVAADTTTTESGLLSGNGGVTKKGAGELILGNTANSFTNIVDIQNGTLSASTIANSNSTSTIGQGPEVKIGSASTAGTFKYTGGTAGMNRTVTVGSAGGTIHVNDNAATMTLNGTVAGSGNTLTKTGAGILAFGSGSSVSLGTIAVQNGTLLLGAANQVGVATNSAANINLSGGTTLKTGFDLTGGTLTLTGTSSSADTIFDFDTGSGNDFAFASTVWSGGALKLANAKDGTVINFGSTFTGSWTDFQTKVAFGASPPSGSGISFGTTGGYTLTVAAIPDARVYTAAAFLLVLIGVTELKRRRRKTVSSKV